MAPYPTLLDYFHDVCRQYPAAVAIDDGSKHCAKDRRVKLTYSELDLLSQQWSLRLRSAGVRPGAVIPLLSRRCVSMVAAILAILKLRATYVPIDLDSWAVDRVNGVLDRINPDLVVATESCPNIPLFGRSVLVLDHSHGSNDILDLNHIPCCKEDRSDPIDDTVYIIFTSGTTGKPKGVAIGQRSISSYVKQGGKLPFNLNATIGSRVLLICSIAFDACAGTLFSTICNGGTLVLANPSTLEYVAKECTTLSLTPSILSSLDPKAGFDAVDQIFLGGETPSPALVEAWTSPSRRLYNAYGPTETTCTAFMGELKPGMAITVGHPIQYSNAVLIDEDGRESSEGEIWISGLGLALGYYKDPDLTDEAFVMFGETRYYRTGDYGKRTADGLQFCGRRDNVLKHHGFLINLDKDVEPALLAADNVERAIAMMAGDMLVAFVTPQHASDGLRTHLLTRCSSFHVPDIMYGLEEFPVTGNGKIDRKALLAIHQAETTVDNTVLLSRGLDPVEAVRRAVSHVLQHPLRNILDTSSIRSLGGHSLAAVKITSALRSMGYTTNVSQVLLLDNVADLAASLQVQKASEASLSSQPELQPLPQNATSAKNHDAIATAAMTDMQIRLVRSSIAHSGLAFIKTSFTLDHPGDGDFVSKLQSAWAKVQERHGILRTSFSLSSPHGSQLLFQNAGIAWEEKLVSESEWESTCRENSNMETHEFVEFDEENRKHLSRVLTVTVPAKCTRFIWTIHHSLIDGWSMAVIMVDLAASLDGKPLLPPLQFSDVAIALKRLETNHKDSAMSFWANNIKSYLPVGRLRLAQPSNSGSYTQSEQRASLTPRMSDLHHAASLFNVTPASLLYAAWAILLSRYCGSDHVVLGAVLSGRNLPISGIEHVVGPLINTLPLAVNVQEMHSTEAFVRSVFRTMCGIMEFQWSTNSLIQEACGTNISDLFETLFVLQYDFPSMPWQSTKISTPRDIQYRETTEVPLTVLVDNVEDKFQLRFLYLQSYFSDSTVRGMAKHFDNVLSALLQSLPECKLETVSRRMMDDSELKLLTPPPKESPNHSDTPKTLAQAINRSILHHSNLTAVEGLAMSLTYSELGKYTALIASQLGAQGARGQVVCVISDGSLNWLLAVVGVVKVGATYCPIDYKLPFERQKYMVENSRASFVLFPTAEAKRASPIFDGVGILETDGILSKGFTTQMCDEEPAQRGDDICCLIFTSGSTGLPKAVQLHHRGILNLLAQPVGKLYSRPGQRNAQALSVGFDCCVLEIFATVTNGATLVLKDPNDPVCNLSQVNAMAATPSLLAALDPADYPDLRTVFTVGEPISQPTSDIWSVGRTFVNIYGPAECTLFCTWAVLESGTKVSVGKPVDGMTAYILDSQMRPVPVGVSGEVYLSGVQVARGYLYQAELTNLRFLSDPFHPHLRMFRTGDIGRRLENGDISLIGREDNMVKLRGFRIDLGEVETAITRVALEAKSSSVIVWNGNVYAFVTPATVDTSVLHTRLSEHLPEYAVPNRVIALDKFPLSANLKVDREKLKEFLASRKADASLSQPLETSTERIIGAIWAEVLGLDPTTSSIGATDHFFALGGHSILQIKVAQAIRKRWDIPLPLKEVVRYQVLRDLCHAIDKRLVQQDRLSMKPTFLQYQPVKRSELPVSYLESEMLLNHYISNGSPAGNMRFICNVRGELDIAALTTAFHTATNHAEIFQSRYNFSCGLINRSRAEADEFLQVVEVDDAEPIIQAKLNRKFDMSVDSPIDVSIIVEGPVETTILVVMSHVVGDARTMANYLDHVSSLYPRQARDVTLIGGSAPSYLDWAKWVEDTLSDTDHIGFWKSYLSDLPEPLIFGNPGAALTYRGTTRSSLFPSSRLSDLSRLSTGLSLTMHQLMMGAIFLCLQCVDTREDIVFAAPFMHRTEPGTEDIPGLFLDRLIFRIRHKAHSMAGSLAGFLKSVQESSQQALAHPIPFRSLRDIIQVKPSLVNPLFKVMVAYHTKSESPMLQLGGTNISQVRRYNKGSKFPVTFEFTELREGGLLFELEHDISIVPDHTAQRIEKSLDLVLNLMVLATPVDRIIQSVTSSFGWAGEAPTAPVPDSERLTSHEDVDEKRNIILGAIAECLGTKAELLDVNQSFWLSGAESIHALKLQYICEQRGVDIALNDIFVCESAADLAVKAILVK